MRIIGLDIHRAFAEAVALQDGVCRRLGRIGMTRDQIEAFAESLQPTDHVVVECTGNATAVLDILAPKVARVAVASPLQVHLIARAKTKTDKIDARVLAKLYAAGGPVAVWCRSFDSIMCSKGDELWAQEERMNFARTRCELH